MYADLSIREFLSQASARTPVPGGGTVSALIGALSASMGAMAGRFSAKEAEAEAAPAVAELDALQAQFLTLMDRDAAAYEKVRAAYRQPKASPEEKSARKQAIAAALEGAVNAPQEGLRHCIALAEALRRLAPHLNANLASDFGVSLSTIEAAAAGFRMNVEVNLGTMGDTPFARSARDAMESASRTLRGLLVDLRLKADAALRGEEG
ncbi:MAG: cyclodeaminase/cyclohydrolase family protein [Planctomycetes bacterium]|nr:cyclodeaminase/cyclohydrolase family protein [Planctomycetota bacterium]